MKIHLQNIGKIFDANIVIDGITVIAGENSTGKSTVSKALFSLFNGSSNMEERIYGARYQSIVRCIRAASRRPILIRQMQAIANEIMERTDGFDEVSLETLLSKYEDMIPKEEIGKLTEAINERLEVSRETICITRLNRVFNIEFSHQINNILSNGPGKISLFIKDKEVMTEILDNEVTDFHDEIGLNTEAIYFDDPFVLDRASQEREMPVGFRRSEILEHKEHLVKKLSDNKADLDSVEESIAKEKTNRIYEKINLACAGDMMRKVGGIEYRMRGEKKSLRAENLSMGMKAFAILKILLQNGAILPGGVVIFDEPEIHLHPAWQIILAETIVLLQKEFSLHVLLNTHSPYFLRAIDIYATKHESGICRYYLAEADETAAKFHEITGNLDAVYKKLLRPFQILENEG